MVQLTNSTAEVTLNTGAKIPQLGLGTWRSTEQEAYDAVLTAIKAGYRHIDSAAIYKNEAVVGKAIKDSGIPREELFVTTKLWGTQHKDPAKALELSLKRLGLDYVDLYLIHWPVAFKAEGFTTDEQFLSIPQNEDGSRNLDWNKENPKEGWNFVKTWELVQDLPKTGKTKAVGVSNFSVNNLKELEAAGLKTPTANQVELHPLLPQNELIAYAKEKGITIEAYSPLGSQDSPLLKNETLKAIADSYEVSIAQVLINWALKRGYVVLPKSITASRIESNFKVFDLKEDDFNKVTDLIKVEGEQRFIVPDWSPFPTFE
ncbi:hypothetical protein WICMUC_004304 [Wickerhamomyces mucosus]|uniref:NADP-dependent oxidoreductase domain-containing protein n=1 Tax=Wickerhamomyces mucosus TaxID=1378264 RepID=A0A9P8TAE1_9ASCO|nr:hypothetical protein WICMUC_004304 [Wickerhamomyces mucosus]